MRHTSFVGSLLPSEQMVAGLVIGGFGFFLGFGTPQFWAILGLGAGWFFHGLAKFVRVGGLKGELARERALHHDL